MNIKLKRKKYDYEHCTMKSIYYHNNISYNIVKQI